MKIGVVLPNWVGDVVMATPTLHALRTHFSTAKIVGIMQPYVAQVVEGGGWLDEQILFNPHGHDRRLHSGPLVKQLRKIRLDRILILTNSFRDAAIARLAGVKQRIGYARNRRDWLLTDRLAPLRRGGRYVPVSAIDYYLQIAQAVGIQQPSRTMRLATVARDEAVAARVWDVLSLNESRHVVLLNTGGAKGPAKDWPQENFFELARRIVDQYDATVLVLCGPAERQVARNIELTVNHPRVKSMAHPDVLPFVDHGVSLGAAKAIVKRADLMVTTDSGPRHFAHAFDVPVVTLYGPTDPAWTLPYHPRSIHLFEKLSCSFCAEGVCPLEHHQCMQSLSVDRVHSACQSLMSSYVLRAA